MSCYLKGEPEKICRQYGHDLIDDPPGLSSVIRKTCQHCGSALLQCGDNFYGSALLRACEKPIELLPYQQKLADKLLGEK